MDKRMGEMGRGGIIEQRPSLWGFAVTTVAKADGSARFVLTTCRRITKPSLKTLANARHEISHRSGGGREIYPSLMSRVRTR